MACRIARSQADIASTVCRSRKLWVARLHSSLAHTLINFGRQPSGQVLHLHRLHDPCSPHPIKAPLSSMPRIFAQDFSPTTSRSLARLPLHRPLALFALSVLPLPVNTLNNDTDYLNSWLRSSVVSVRYPPSVSTTSAHINRFFSVSPILFQHLGTSANIHRFNLYATSLPSSPLSTLD